MSECTVLYELSRWWKEQRVVKVSFKISRFVSYLPFQEILRLLVGGKTTCWNMCPSEKYRTIYGTWANSTYIYMYVNIYIYYTCVLYYIYPRNDGRLWPNRANLFSPSRFIFKIYLRKKIRQVIIHIIVLIFFSL